MKKHQKHIFHALCKEIGKSPLEVTDFSFHKVSKEEFDRISRGVFKYLKHKKGAFKEFTGRDPVNQREIGKLALDCVIKFGIYFREEK